MALLPVGSESPDVKAKQVTLLFSHLPVILLATSLNSAILTLALWNHASHRVLVSWLICIQLTALLRCVLLLTYRRNPEGESWGRWFSLGTWVSGILWFCRGAPVCSGIGSASDFFDVRARRNVGGSGDNPFCQLSRCSGVPASRFATTNHPAV